MDMGKKGRDRRIGKNRKKIAEIRQVFGLYIEKEFVETSQAFFYDLAVKKY